MGQGLATAGKLSKDAAKGVARGTQKVLVEPTRTVAEKTDQLAVQPLQKAVQGAAKGVAHGAQKVLVEPTQTVFEKTDQLAVQPLQKAVQGAAHKLSGTTQSKTEVAPADAAVLSDEMALPPDEQLLAMDVLFTKQLANVSPSDWHGKFWENAPLYEEFWRACDKQDIDIGEWEKEGDGSMVQNPYDEENYTHRRTVRFSFTPTIMGRKLYPKVTTIEHCRSSEDRCVATASTDCVGIPFGDAFQVQLRWVGTRVGQNDLLLQLGLYVLFKKSVLVAGQIRSATREETIETQLQLFETMKEACGAQESTVKVVAAEEDAENHPGRLDLCSKPPADLLRSCVPTAPERIFKDDLERELFEVRELLQTLAASALVDEQRTTVHAALELVADALDGILVRKLGLEDTTTAQAEEETGGSKSSLFKTSLVKSITSPLEEMNSVFVRRISKTTKRAKSLNLSQFMVSSTKDAPEEPIDPSFDKVLQSMDVVVSKFFYNTTLNELYDLLLKRQKTPGQEDSLYETCLRNRGQLEIQIGEWEEQGSEKGFMDPWSKESYAQKRVVSYQSPRKSDFFLKTPDSPALMDVKQTQYCRREANKLIFATTEESTGASFSKSVKVYRRLVISQVEDKKLSFKCGTFILFARPELLAPKIRASVTQETRRTYTELFSITRATLYGEGVKKTLKERFEFKGIEEDEEPSCFVGLMGELRRAFRPSSSPVLQEDSDFKDEIKTIRGKLKAVEEMLDDREANSMEDLNFYSGQLVIAREALDSVLAPSL